VSIKLVITDEKGEELTTLVDCEEDIVIMSLTHDFDKDETIVNAFESTAELFRLSGYVTMEEATEEFEAYYDWKIERDYEPEEED